MNFIHKNKLISPDKIYNYLQKSSCELRPINDSIKFYVDIVTILQNMHPGMKFDFNAIKEVDNFLTKLTIKLNLLSQKITNSMNVSYENLILAADCLISGQLGKHSYSEGNKAVVNYQKIFTGNVKDPNYYEQSENAAQISFSIKNSEYFCKKLGINVEKTFIIFMTTVQEYICSEILSSAGTLAQEQSMKKSGETTITEDHIISVIINDEELSQLFKNI